MKLKNKSFIYLFVTFILIAFFIVSTSVSAKEVTVHAGKIIYVENVNTLNPSNLSVGDDVELITISDVVVDDIIIIKAGTPVSGAVTKAQGEGALGKAGQLTISVNSVEALDGTILGLSGTKILAGESKETEAVGGGLFLCAPMLLISGEGVELPANSTIEARITGTYDIDGIEK